MALIDCDQFGGRKGSELNLLDQKPGEYIYIRVVDQGNNTKGDFAMCDFDDSSVGGFVSQTKEDEFSNWYFDQNSEAIILLKEQSVETQIKQVVFESELDVFVYPNPISDYLFVRQSSDTTIEMIISDMVGVY